MTFDEATKILEALMIVNGGDNTVEIEADFELDAYDNHMCRVWVFSDRYFGNGKPREIIENFCTLDIAPQECVDRIMKYNKEEKK